MTRAQFRHLDALENQSVYILREAHRKFKRLAMLWSIGKDSSVWLWLARKAFFGHVPMPCVHVDTSYKIPEMIQFRDQNFFVARQEFPEVDREWVHIAEMGMSDRRAVGPGFADRGCAGAIRAAPAQHKQTAPVRTIDLLLW